MTYVNGYPREEILTPSSAEEVELEEGLKAELAQLPAEEDEDMEGAADTAGAKAEDDESDAGSEDLEAESSGSEDEDEDVEVEVEEADDDMEMVRSSAFPIMELLHAHGNLTTTSQQGEDGETTAAPGQVDGQSKEQPAHQQPHGDVMVMVN